MSNPNTRFSDKLFCVIDDHKKNIFFSPYSLQSALAMCLAGASKDTHKALSELLEVNSEGDAEYLRSLTSEDVTDKPYELTTANALWYQKGFSILDSFKEFVLKDYHGSVEEVDFENNPAESKKIINEWCDKATRGKISEILDKVDKETVFVLANAIYFLGKWKSRFDKKMTFDQDFHNFGGKISKIPTMHKSDNFLYGEFNGFKALELPYEGDDLSMLVILPDEFPKNSDELSSKLPLYAESVNALVREKVDVSLPKFEMETLYSSLVDNFESLGAGVAFSDHASFSGISEEPVKITKVVHKAYVKCDEEGTEAAAVTAVTGFRCTSFVVNSTFTVDRPFMFFIRSIHTNSILFAGRIMEL